MDSNIGIQPKMYPTFKKEWLSSHFIHWEDFIASKDLGITCFNKISSIDTTIGLIAYKIVDEKKWLLAKIKYGI